MADLALAAAARMPAADVLAALGSSEEGLSTAEASARLAEHGPNALRVHRVTALGVLLRQLRNPLLALLLAAAAVSGLTGDPTDAVIIATIVVLSVGLGFMNEYRSERAVVDVVKLVPGDVVDVRIGPSCRPTCG
jgi:Mg2+-importing ATPase